MLNRKVGKPPFTGKWHLFLLQLSSLALTATPRVVYCFIAFIVGTVPTYKAPNFRNVTTAGFFRLSRYASFLGGGRYTGMIFLSKTAPPWMIALRIEGGAPVVGASCGGWIFDYRCLGWRMMF